MNDLLLQQISHLEEAHLHLLYWTAIGEDKKKYYNLTNAFDDLKFHNITRTKQSSIAYVSVLKALCLLEIREESNRKNLYITTYGAQALQELFKRKKYKNLKSNYLEK